MSFEPVNKIVMENIAIPYTSLSGIMDSCVECGWTLHDSDYENTNPYAVLKSHPDATDDSQSPCYVGFRVFSNSTYWLRMYFFLHWDNVAHTYNGTLGSYGFTDSRIYYRDYMWNQLMIFGTLNNLTIYGNKYFLNFRNNIWEGYTEALHIFKLQNVPNDYVFKIEEDVDSGPNKTFKVEDGAADDIDIGDLSFILCKDNHTFSKISVNNTSTVSGTITIDEMKWPTVSGSYIGAPVALYPWAFCAESSYNYGTNTSRDNTFHTYRYAKVDANYSASSAGYTGNPTGNYWFPDCTKINNLNNVGHRTVINHPVFYNSSTIYEILGETDYFATGIGTEGEILLYNKCYIGQATSGTSNTLVEANKSWETNCFAEKAIVISEGESGGDIRHILSNNSDTITIYDTFNSTFTYIPDNTSMYFIFEAVYVVCYHSGGDYRYSIRIA